MCIRITKDLKLVYENVMDIDLSQKIFYPTFCTILQILGYIEKSKDVSTKLQGHRRQLGAPCNDPLIRLAWSTIRTTCPIDDVTV